MLIKLLLGQKRSEEMERECRKLEKEKEEMYDRWPRREEELEEEIRRLRGEEGETRRANGGGDGRGRGEKELGGRRDEDSETEGGELTGTELAEDTDGRESGRGRMGTLQSLPKDITEILAKYRVPSVEAQVQHRTGRCYICSSHKNNKTTVTCHSCQQFVCKTHSNKTVSCNNCLYPPMEED